MPYHDYIYNIAIASTDFYNFILVIMRHFGVFGNTVFFVCSAWFLLRSCSFSKRKWLFMVIEIWFLSISILAISEIILHGHISPKIVIKSLFPTTFSTNWYMTCYLLFYPLHPYLNRLIDGMSKRTMFRVMLTLSFVYIGIDMVSSKLLYGSDLLLWIAIYFVIAYMEKYMPNMANSIKDNLGLLAISAIGFILLLVCTEFLGLHIAGISQKMLHWNSNCNIFIIAMMIAAFNIVRQIHFKNHFINYISKLSLVIYIIHENIVLRTYFRPQIWEYIHNTYGYEHIITWVILIASGIFLFALIAAVLYNKLLQNFVNRTSNTLYDLWSEKYPGVEKKIMALLN